MTMSDGQTSAAMPCVEIYTDGGCEPNPVPGGYGAVLLHPKKICRPNWATTAIAHFFFALTDR